MSIHSELNALLEAGETVATVTVTETEGSTPQNPGATMLVRADGDTTGTIGGGTVEELSREAAVEAIEERTPARKRWELTPQGNTGMVCGGEMTVFINVHSGTQRLLIGGGGHIAQPLAEMAASANYDVSVVDDRETYATADRFPEATVFHGDYGEGIEEFGVTDNTAVAVATRSGTFDRETAREALLGGAYYVGIVASETKAAHIREKLSANDNGVDDAMVDRIHSPAGLDLGGGSPESIAVSILAEIETVRNRGDGEPLSGGDRRRDGDVIEA